jgi:hypothetical protein
MTALNDVSCARIPAAALAALGSARCARKIEVLPDGDHFWLRWDEADDRLLRLVLPLPGIELFVRRDTHWSRFGQRLPCPGPPENVQPQRLDQVLFPERVEPAPPGSAGLQPCRLHLVADDRPRPTTAARCALAALLYWADTATTAQLHAVRASRVGDEALLLGDHLPLLPGSVRFWGGRVLVPLGMRPEPALPESSLIEVLGLSDGEIAVLADDSVQVFAADVFGPLTRSGIRRAAQEGQA